MPDPQRQSPKRQPADEALHAPSISMRDLARRLLAAEAASRFASDPHVQEAALVNEKLRTQLIEFAGADGYAALLRRVLALARAEAPVLASAKVSADGHLEGLEQLATHVGSVANAAALAITAHLLELLVTFIGEPLTLRLVRNAWPNTSLDE